MERINGFINPRIEFYNPQGMQVYSGSSTSFLNSGTLQLNDPGNYTILSMDQNIDGTGTYYIKIE